MGMDWDTSPDAVVAFVAEETKKHTYETAYKLWDAIMELSPVRTGQYRASWNMTVDQPKYTTVDVGGAPGSPLPPPKRPYLRASSGLPTVYIVNGKPYAERIEYGWSGQAPFGVVINAMAII